MSAKDEITGIRERLYEIMLKLRECPQVCIRAQAARYGRVGALDDDDRKKLTELL
jgi:hypothetical protein